MPRIDADQLAADFARDLQAGVYDEIALDWRAPEVRLVETATNLCWLAEQSVYSGVYLSGICVGKLDDLPEEQARVLEASGKPVRVLEVIIVLAPDRKQSLWGAGKLVAAAMQFAEEHEIRLIRVLGDLSDSRVLGALRSAGFAQLRDGDGRLEACYYDSRTAEELEALSNETLKALIEMVREDG